MYDNTGKLVTVGNDVPRFSYDPADLTKPPAFLYERASTNYVSASEDFGGFWDGYFGKPSLNKSYPAPDGTNNATRLGSRDAGPVDAPGLSGLITYNNTGAMIYGVITVSIWVRCVSGTITLNFGITDGADAVFYNIGTTWRRISFTAERTILPNDRLIQIKENEVSNPEWEVWGAQAELGGVASSYIKTIGAPATRAADVPGTDLISALGEYDADPFSPTKVYTLGDQVMNAHRIWQSVTGAYLSGAVFSNSGAGTAYTITLAAHGAKVNDAVSFTADTLPNGLVDGQVYYVKAVPTADTFTISATKGGAAITGSTFGDNIFCKISGNYQTPPWLYPEMWLDAGPTNKYAMLDQSVESQSRNLLALSFAVISPAALLVDSIVLQNVVGRAARVTVTDLTDGLVYDKTITLTSPLDSADFYAYCFEPVTRNTEVLFTGLPPYGNTIISVSVASDSDWAKCGVFVGGQSKDFGPTQAGMSLGIQDYSVKETDEFGFTVVKQRSFAKTMTLSAFVRRAAMSNLINLLNSLRATPAVYLGDDTVGASFQYGFFKTYSMGADYPDHSILHIEIESLT